MEILCFLIIKKYSGRKCYYGCYLVVNPELKIVENVLIWPEYKIWIMELIKS